MGKTQVTFTIDVNALPQKVWDVLWTDSTYQQWTTVFAEGSRAVSDWKEGSEVLFVNADGNGMYSKIEKMTIPTEMSFLHLGEIKDDVRTVTEWGDGYERYFLTEKNGGTELRVTVDSVADFVGFFNETFPKALAIVKTLSES